MNAATPSSLSTNAHDLPPLRTCIQAEPYARVVQSFHLETRIAAPIEACFDLSLSVDAHAASMAGSGERAIAGVTTGTMGLGDSVTWRARHFGIPFTMTSLITAHDRPHRFVDEQVHGPFAMWWHEHTFTARDSTTTLMVDVVRFAAPLGPAGLLAEHLVLARYMTRLIERRNRWLTEALEDPGMLR